MNRPAIFLEPDGIVVPSLPMPVPEWADQALRFFRAFPTERSMNSVKKLEVFWDEARPLAARVRELYTDVRIRMTESGRRRVPAWWTRRSTAQQHRALIVNLLGGLHPKGWFLPGALQALGAMQDAGYAIYFVTNQGHLVRRGVAAETIIAYYAYVASWLRALQIAVGTKGHTQLCLHLEGEKCECRKPGAGMFMAIAHQEAIDFAESWQIERHQEPLGAAGQLGMRAISLRDTSTLWNAWEKIHAQH